MELTSSRNSSKILQLCKLKCIWQQLLAKRLSG
jgi:hypothetical protein